MRQILPAISLWLTLWCVLTGWSAFAQSDRGTITGTVADPAGAVVANAPIQARNVDNGALYEGATSTTGNYTLAQLPAGTYEVSVSVPGFKKYTRQGLTVQVAEVLRIDMILEVGSSSESVTVSEAAALLNTESGDLSHNVSTSTMDSLPILGIGTNQAGSTGIRNPNAVLELIPGTFYSGNSQVRINGVPNNTQGIQIEGMDATNGNNPNITGATQASVDAIQEMTIQVSNYAAEFGQVGGGLFSITMKSGTNQFHGTGYDYFVNEDLNAGAPFTDAPAGTGNPRARQRRNDYGFTLGGPIWLPKIYNGRDRTFFFFSWEEYREAQTVATQFATIPTTAYRSGDFSAAILPNAKVIGTDPLGRQMLEGMVYDPNSTRTVNGVSVRDPFPNNAVPQNRFDPVAVKIQDLYPQPKGPDATALVNNYLPVFPTARVTTVPSIKGDHLFGTKGKLSFYWTRVRSSAAPPGPPNGTNSGLPDPLVTATATFIRTHIERLNYDHTLSPTLLLHFGAGYQNVSQDLPTVTSTGAQLNYNAAQELGLHGAIVNRFFPPMSGLLAANGTGGSVNLGGATDANSLTQRPTFNTSLTWVKNNHTYKIGSEFRTEGYPAINVSNTSGSYVFSPAQTGQPFQNTAVNGTNVGFGYASFLLGQVQQVSISNPVEPRLGKKQFGVYAQDSWKITRRLTFDYGIRYDYSTYLREQYGRAPFFSAAAVNPKANRLGGTIYDGSGPGRCNCSVANNYPYAVAPRLGVAYQITPKTVARGGFGIVYSGTETNNQAAGGLAGSSNTIIAPSFGASVTSLAVGIPASFDPPPWPNYDPGQYPTGFPTPGGSAPLVDQNAGRPARQYQWSVGVQREIFKNLAVEAAYVGNLGVWWNAPILLNLNELTPQILAAVGLDPTKPADQALLTSTLSSATAAARGFNKPAYAGFPLGQTVAQALRPYPQYTTIPTYWDPLGKTWYNALQLKATKRFSHGLSFVSTFAWSKSLTLGAENDPGAGTGGLALANDVMNRNANKYLSLYDQPLQFNISANYTTPNLRTNKIVSWLARDWTYGVYVSYRSGLPLEVPIAQNNPNLSNLLFQPTFANRVAGQPLFLKDLNCHCFDPQTTVVLNPNAWADPPTGQFGSSPAYYSDFRKQRRPQENMNLGRTWRIKERATLNIRAEFTNVFNRSVVGDPTDTNAKAQITYLPNGNISGGFGSINATSSPTGTGTAAIVNLAPRNGTLVARFTF
ncbi:MAG TPA: TonB-dependent receptor [Bryobacteraceae bacterium]|nr:TonB-dependent receptor [Bryobacteraceae bacterium]